MRVIRELKLLISKKNGRIYKNVDSLIPAFSTEEELMRYIHEEHGEGLYMIQYSAKGKKGVSKAIWRGYIRPEGDEKMGYMNKLQGKRLEEVTDIEQKSPGDRHVFKPESSKVIA